ncbi:hypothetical protein ACV229_03730 [Burkholderia sp. MR1-5-21]
MTVRLAARDPIACVQGRAPCFQTTVVAPWVTSRTSIRFKKFSVDMSIPHPLVRRMVGGVRIARHVPLSESTID